MAKRRRHTKAAPPAKPSTRPRKRAARSSTSHLASFIRQCRLSQGLTTREIEKICGARTGLKPLKHSNLAAIEQSRYIPRFDDILTLGMVLNIPVHHFEDKLKLDMMGQTAPEAPGDWDEVMHLAKAVMETGNCDGALAYFRHALALAVDSGGRGIRWAETKLHIANCLRRLGLLRIAKEEIEELMTGKDLDAQMLVRANFVLGDIFRYTGNHKLALLHLEEAQRRVESAGGPLLLGKVYLSLADLYADLARFREAAVLYRNALKNFKDLGEIRLQITAEIALGIVMAEPRDFDESLQALRVVESGLHKAQARGYRRETALAHLALAKIHFYRKAFKSAVRHAEESKGIAQDESQTDVLFQSIYYLWEVAKLRKQSQLAAVYRQRLRQLRSRIEPGLREVGEFDKHLDKKD